MSLRVAVLFLCCCLAAGCGGKKTYRLSGKVTFKGNSIPAGKIYFYPDSTKGNSGPAGYADIKDGQYDTDWKGGAGTVGGPMKVAIEAWDPATKVEKADSEPTAKPLFPRFEMAVDLPKENGTKDFDVTAEALKKASPPFAEPKDGGP